MSISQEALRHVLRKTVKPIIRVANDVIRAVQLRNALIENKIVFVHRCTRQNVGDYWASPCSFYSFARPIFRIDIHQFYRVFHAHDNFPNLEGRTVVVGGGLFDHPSFEKELSLLTSLSEHKCHLVVWGAGHNKPFESRPTPEWISNTVLSKADLVGVRDSDQDAYDWVPCTSCLSKHFDVDYHKAVRVGAFLHRHDLSNKAFLDSLYSRQVPVLWHHRTTLKNALSFIGSCETLLTSSYHGMYWGQLLGCKVIAIPTSSKFYSLPFPPSYSDAENWPFCLSLPIATYSFALDACRNANNAFRYKIKNLLDI